MSSVSWCITRVSLDSNLFMFMCTVHGMWRRTSRRACSSEASFVGLVSPSATFARLWGEPVRECLAPLGQLARPAYLFFFFKIKCSVYYLVYSKVTNLPLIILNFISYFKTNCKIVKILLFIRKLLSQQPSVFSKMLHFNFFILSTNRWGVGCQSE